MSVDWSLLIAALSLAVSLIVAVVSERHRRKDEIESRPYIDVRLDWGIVENGHHHQRADGGWTVEFEIRGIYIVNYGRGTARNFVLEIFGSTSPTTNPRHIILHKDPIHIKYILPSNTHSKYIITNEVGGDWNCDIESPTYIYCRVKYEYMGRVYGGKDNEDGLIKTWDDGARNKTHVERVEV